MKIVSVLYPAGKLAERYPNLLGCEENALGLREFLKEKGHEYISISDMEEELNKHLADTEILITTPFWPLYVTKDKMDKAPKLRMILTAGVGSDHIDLKAARDKKITVAEITGSNVVSVAEHIVMQILILVRNFVPSYKQVLDGKWDVGEIASNAHDLENKTVGIIGAGRIGQRVLARLKPFNVKLVYYDFYRLSTAEEILFNTNFLTLKELLSNSDVVSISCPLTPRTDGLLNKDKLKMMKKGAYIVNTARGKIVNTMDLVETLKSGEIGGYAGDVWYPQPAPKDHPWRKMPNHAMTPHVSGTTLEAQKRYSDGIKECLDSYFSKQPIERDYIIVENGEVVSPSYSYAFEE